MGRTSRVNVLIVRRNEMPDTREEGLLQGTSLANRTVFVSVARSRQVNVIDCGSTA
jgi:hypothetical protein